MKEFDIYKMSFEECEKYFNDTRRNGEPLPREDLKIGHKYYDGTVYIKGVKVKKRKFKRR